MRRTPHTSTTPGKRVRLKLRNGCLVDGKFIERRHHRFIVLDVNGQERRFTSDTIDKFIVMKAAPLQGEEHGA